MSWLDPVQTAEKTLPFLYTSGFPVLNRSLFPGFHTPMTKSTYSAVVQVMSHRTHVSSYRCVGWNQSRPRESSSLMFLLKARLFSTAPSSLALTLQQSRAPTQQQFRWGLWAGQIYKPQTVEQYKITAMYISKYIIKWGWSKTYYWSIFVFDFINYFYFLYHRR